MMTSAPRPICSQKRQRASASCCRCWRAVPGIAAYVWLIGPVILVQLASPRSRHWLAEADAQAARQAAGLFLSDGSAIVTAWLIALTFPPLAPWWLIVVGTLFAIVVAKHLYGGLGQNPFNPAMVAFAVCIVSFPALMSQWPPSACKLVWPTRLAVVFGLRRASTR
jgi:electron transport complex protein RnfD